ncbi:MAG: ParB/RepB/Spo0J family partition protein [Pseudomonadota bacterium]|nr:ParB/RepB/Spo0J family partition protein [Pseudomonadota bacterium]
MPTAAATDFADLAEGSISTIPLDRLMLSALNVRQTERAADVDSLAEDIAARGLKQNLVVIPAHFATGESQSTHEGGKGWEGHFEVIAGGRRFQAMQRLVEQERLSPTFPVPCMIEPRDTAAETSLSENLHRVAMNPADEFEAFRVIVEKFGSDEVAVGICAKRFGVTVKHVKGRLRLATLAPEILEALRANQIGVESAKAYAGTEDHALQLSVFTAQQKSHWQPHNAASVRGALRGHSLSLDDGLVKFVGVDAYVEAGGRVETEMFMGTDGQERIMDLQLLAKLGQEKAQPMVEPQAKKDGFKSGLLASGVGSQAKWPKAPAGMERFVTYYSEKKPTKAQLRKSVAVYAIAYDGTGIEKIGHFHTPKPKAPREERDWEAERLARQHEGKVERRAAQLAVYDVGKFTGTPFEGHTFWPGPYCSPVELDPQDENFALVAVLVRIPAAEIEAKKEEAERLIDEEAAAAAAESQGQEKGA